jgi:hypothetical protein
MRFIVLLASCVFPLLASAVKLNESGIEPGLILPLKPLKPFVATYDVKRGGKVIGEATMTLSRAGDKEWTLVTETRGTAGMAKLLGLDVREESRFTDINAYAMQSVDYRYKQDATLKSKQRHIEFDWSANEARVTDKDELFRYAMNPGALDRQLVVLALARTTTHEPSLTLSVAGKESVEQQVFERRENRPFSTPAGEFSAVRFERTDKPGKGSSWHAAQTLAPLQIEQVQKDGNNIVMELRKLR